MRSVCRLVVVVIVVVVVVVVEKNIACALKVEGTIIDKWSPQVPSADNYDDVYAMIDNEQIPWPHGKNQSGGRKNLTPAEIRALAKKYLSMLPASQNATCIALIIYNWSLPTYRQYNFPQVAMKQNATAIGNMITYLREREIKNCCRSHTNDLFLSLQR